mmetsp:Transcript_19762/g.38703  ORF Transcript_19762/g.38703 Transcript_19762/m.38703 type:complete len:227 (-) Transcript_19762:367-1047(-)
MDRSALRGAFCTVFGLNVRYASSGSSDAGRTRSSFLSRSSNVQAPAIEGKSSDSRNVLHASSTSGAVQCRKALAYILPARTRFPRLTSISANFIQKQPTLTLIGTSSRICRRKLRASSYFFALIMLSTISVCSFTIFSKWFCVSFLTTCSEAAVSSTSLRVLRALSSASALVRRSSSARLRLVTLAANFARMLAAAVLLVAVVTVAVAGSAEFSAVLFEGAVFSFS